MAATPRSPKQWCLTKTEIVTSFENWRQNLLYTLSLDAQFAPFLLDGATWSKKTKKSPDSRLHRWRFFSTRRKPPYCSTKSEHAWVNTWPNSHLLSSYLQKHHRLEFNIYGLHLVSHTPAFRLRSHGLISLIFRKSTSSTANNLRIFTKYLSLLQDNLLRSNSIQHHGAFLTEDEGLNPTLEKFIVYFIPTKGLRWNQAFLYSRTTCVPAWRTGRWKLECRGPGRYLLCEGQWYRCSSC